MDGARKLILKRLDCLSSTLLLTLNWDEKLFRKWMRRHGLLKHNYPCDSVLILHRLHQECHDADSLTAAALIRHFTKSHIREEENLRRQKCDLQSDSLLLYTASRLEEAPGAIFWAMAADERPEVASLLAYHAHRLAACAFQIRVGSVFSVAKLHRELSGTQARAEQLERANASLTGHMRILEHENESLRRELAEMEDRKRELRMLRYELGMTAHCPVPATEEKHSIPASPRKTLLIETDSPCPFKNATCAENTRGGRCTLEKLKIALVGGLERLESQYRSVFESLGVEKFYFHSGCCDGSGADRLRSSTEAADIVVFITRVNSHNALSVLKGVCKKSKKSFLAVRETGPEQISRIVLNELNRSLRTKGT